MIFVAFPSCRDIATYIRTEVQKAFVERKFDANPEQCDKSYLALKRIVEDYHFNLYKRHSTSSATGLTSDQCRQILSPEFLDALEKQEQGLFRRIFSTKN